ncbi:MAG: single-stranded DNA-binding protein [Gammaproteobacteria bacterium]
MNGIHAAFTGRIGKDAEVRGTRDGKPWASSPVAADSKSDGETPATWVRVALFGDSVGDLAPRLTKGAEVYREGRLSLGTWTGRDGEARAGLNLAAWAVCPMGQIGRRKPKARDGRQDASVERPGVHAEHGGAPFDDPLRF